MSATITRHLSIRGLVQGVGFRQYMVFKAQQLGIGGWVRNRSDGSVEAVVQGTEDAVAAIVEYAQRGPRASQVSGVTVSDVENAGNFSGRFDPRRNA
ncbi:MAG: acylphosphatase [Burkholderiales bacterium]|nr:acylphosphatase [Burkholderiales bacterium]